MIRPMSPVPCWPLERMRFDAHNIYYVKYRIYGQTGAARLKSRKFGCLQQFPLTTLAHPSWPEQTAKFAIGA